jgi:hypothetical protein
MSDKTTTRAVRKPLTPEGARMVIENPRAGWDAATMREARDVAQGLTKEHLDPAELGRMAQNFGEMHERSEGAALARWLVGFALAGSIIIGAVAWWAYPARGHEAPAGWSYDPGCCSDYDCAPIPASAVTLAPDGWRIRLAPGQHRFVREALDVVVPFGDPRIRRSGDGGWHACISPSTGRVLCVYEPERLG